MCNSYSPNPNHTENLTCRVHGADNGDVHTPHVGNDKGGIQFLQERSIAINMLAKGNCPFLRNMGESFNENQYPSL